MRAFVELAEDRLQPGRHDFDFCFLRQFVM